MKILDYISYLLFVFCCLSITYYDSFSKFAFIFLSGILIALIIDFIFGEFYSRKNRIVYKYTKNSEVPDTSKLSQHWAAIERRKFEKQLNKD